MYRIDRISSLQLTDYRVICLAIFPVLVLSTFARAGEWTIEPQVSVEQSITDNARSASDGEQADLITTATAGIDVAGNGRRAQLNFNYSLSRDTFWDNSDLNGLRQSLLGAGNIEAVEDFVFIDTRATISQQSLQRGGGLTATDRTIDTGDQSTIVNYSITPNFAHRYRNWADSDVRYTFSETRFLESDVGGAAAQPDTSRSHVIQTLLRSGPRFTKLKWQVSGTRTFTNNDSDSSQNEASAEYAWNRFVTVLASGGSESIDNAGINSDDSAEFFWSGGVRLRPGPRTTVRLEIEKRFGTTNFSGDASYQISPLTAVTASYAVTVQTDRQALLANLGGLVLDDTGVLVDPGTGLPGAPSDSNFDFLDRVSRSETFNFALNGTRGRNTYNVNASATIRSQEPEDTEDIVVTIGGNINRRIWPNLNGGISANLSVTTESADGIEDYIFNSSAFLNYRIQEGFSGNLQYSFLRRDSDDDTADVQENVISVSLRKSF